MSYEENKYMQLYIFDVLCIKNSTPRCLGAHLIFPGVFHYNYHQLSLTNVSHFFFFIHCMTGSHEDFSPFVNSHSIILPARSYSAGQFSPPLKRYQSGSQILHQADLKPDHPPRHHIRYRSSGTCY